MQPLWLLTSSSSQLCFALSLLPSNPQYPSQVLALEAIYLPFIVLGALPSFTAISRTGQTKVLNRRILVLLPIPLAAQTTCFLQTMHSVFATSTPLEGLNEGSTPGGRGGTWVFFGRVCAARNSKLAPRSKKKIPLKLIPRSRNGPILYTPF